MFEFIGGFALGMFVGNVVLNVVNRKSNKRTQSREQEKIDRYARSIITTYGKSALIAMSNEGYWITGYLREHPMHHKIVIRIPEMMRIMAEEEKIQKEIACL